MTSQSQASTDSSAVRRSPGRIPEDAVVMARLERPRSATRTRIALLSDPHVSTGKRGTWKLYHRTRARFRAALADIAARDVQGVAIAGDLTEDGRAADFEWIRTRLDGLDLPLLAVPGNHDVPKSFDEHTTPPVEEFEEAFAADGFPSVVRAGGVDLIGLNSAAAPDGALFSTHDGLISPDQLDRLDAALERAENPVVVTHHNLPGLGGEEDAWIPHDPVRDAESLLDVFAAHGVSLHVSGHIHVPSVGRTGGVTGLVCPALCSFPQAYLLLDVHERGTTVTYVPVGGPAETAEAYEVARTHSTRSEAVAELVSERLDAFPLVDDAPPIESSGR